MLRLIELKGWRDRVIEYDHDPTSKSVSPEDRTRFMLVSYGDNDALHVDKGELTMDRMKKARMEGALTLSKSKKEEIKQKAGRAIEEFEKESTGEKG